VYFGVVFVVLELKPLKPLKEKLVDPEPDEKVAAVVVDVRVGFT
jgi:hypothetical protein